MHNNPQIKVRSPMVSLANLSDAILLRDLCALIVRHRITTANLLAYIGEVDARELYRPAGYSSMHAYCVGELGFSEESALRRIQAARAMRRFPELFEALAEGRLHLTAVCILSPYLTQENASELIEAAGHRRKFEIEQLLARRFPLHEAPAPARAVVPLIGPPEQSLANIEHALAHVECDLLTPTSPPDEHSLANVRTSQVEAPQSSSERYLVQITIGKSTHENLRYAQALLSHAVPGGDVGQVFDRALKALIAQLEKRKVGAIAGRSRPSPSRRPSIRYRHIPAEVRRAVWERDQGQCTFVSVSGLRCKSTKLLEFDHIDPVARGGRATVDNMRLRCRAHNQYEAERVFGSQFMKRKRQEAAEAKARALAEERVAEERAVKELAAKEQAARELAAKEQARREQVKDVFAGLRSLGCRVDEARRAAAFTESLGDASLEERMRAALGFLSRKLIATSG